MAFETRRCHRPVIAPRHSARSSNAQVKQHTVLVTSIALVAVCAFGAPRPAYGEINPADVQDFAAKDVNRLRGQVIRAVVQKSPYVDVLEGGTLESGISDTQRVVIQERAVLNQSLVRPAFTLDTEMCGQTGPAAEVGSTEYTYALATNRGKGPLVCIKGMWSAFKTAYSAAENSLRSQLVQLNNADVRITLVDRSGCKAVCRHDKSFEQMFDGTIQAIDTPFPNMNVLGLPTAAPNIKFLQSIGRYMREVLLVEPWEAPASGMVLRLIGGTDIIDFLREDAEVRTDLRYVAAGSYDIGKNSLLKYTWEGPYKGFTFGIDPEPLRFNIVDSSGQPVFIEPQIAVEVDNKVASRPNPTWVRAKYEVLLLMGQNSFRKLTPETYTGEGSFKFPAQGVSGELMWLNQRDNDQNAWQDYGRHYYQFSRAYKPERPHAVCPIAFARNQTDFGLSLINAFGNWSATGSI